MDKLKSSFYNPDPKFKPVPFWSWNNKLEKHEIQRQIKEMHNGGFGGYFIHSRPGLKTKYFSDEWMNMIEYAIEEGNNIGLRSWLYDEDKWPSGFAGGKIPLLNNDFRFRYLIFVTDTQLDEFLKNNLRSQLNLAKNEDFILNHLVKEFLISETKIGNSFYSFYEWISPLGDKWFNNTSYVDLLNDQCVKSFIESTYEKYKDKFSDKFGSIIPGIFTDEPAIWYWAKIPFRHVPWTKEFPNIFLKKNDYSIENKLIQLFLNIDDYKKTRYDYYNTISELFRNSFTKQISNWCTANNIQFTGHFLHEDNLENQILSSGSIMPNYEYLDIPGIDMLGNHFGQVGNYLTVKQCSSVAEQLGKERVLSETFGGAGWEFSFQKQKLLAEIQVVLGVNFFTPHLLAYSLEGSRKRDYPPSLFYHQPYWKDYILLNDYFTKICSVLSEGKRDVNILLIHPIESAWLDFNPNDNEKVKLRNKDLMDIISSLLHNQKDFHFGDEILISNHGKIIENKFVIDEYKYDYVVLPSLETIRKTTLDLIEIFVNNSGKLIVINESPKLVDGIDIGKFNIPHQLFSKNDFIDSINKIFIQDYFLKGKYTENILIQKRNVINSSVYYILNRSEDHISEFELIVKNGKKYFQKWDLFKNERYILENITESEITTLILKVEPMESLLIINTDVNEELSLIRSDEGSEKVIEVLDGDWRINSKTLNCFTLDYCQYKIDGKGYSKILPVLEVQNNLSSFGGKTISLRYEFELESRPSLIDEIYLVIESSQSNTVYINNAKLSVSKDDWYLDISFKKTSIKDFIRSGMNIVEIVTEISENTELESIYIIGDFCLKTINDRLFSMVHKEKTINTGNFIEQGYPFFSGIIELTHSFEVPNEYQKCILEFNRIDAVLLKIYINNIFVDNVFCNPMKLDITKYINNNFNEIKIEMISSLRNILGPHHILDDKYFITCPESFYDEDNWDYNYNFVPFGLLKPPLIKYY